MLAVFIGYIIVLLDQASKAAIRRSLVPGESRPVLEGLFNLNHVRNTGAVWGSFQSQNEWLVVFSLLTLLALAVFYRWLVDHRGVHRVAVGCMLGGIVGNLIDRFNDGWVMDFLDFHWRHAHWPSFNLADAAICAGVAVYILFSFRTPSSSSGVPEKTLPGDASASP